VIVSTLIQSPTGSRVASQTTVAASQRKTSRPVEIALLTGGHDKHYAVGLATALAQQGVRVDFVASDVLKCPEVTENPSITFLNLRGDQSANVPMRTKVSRLLGYYVKLMSYVASARPRVLHILWHNKFELFDRTVLILFYRLVGKQVVFTAHNVNAAKRDGHDNWSNRLSLWILYRLCACTFAHTERMKRELIAEFGVKPEKVCVIPYGINNMIPTTAMTNAQARQAMGIAPEEKTALFFGMIAPYKGLDYLIDALAILAKQGTRVRLMVAGQVKEGAGKYWDDIQKAIDAGGVRDSVILRIAFIPDEDLELYYKSADVVIVPYTDIFQSGIPFMAFTFGLPVIATDVGSLREDVIDDKTGFITPPRDSAALARTIERYFASDLFRNLEARREDIRTFATEHHSWTTVAQITSAEYARVIDGKSSTEPTHA
jgi:D-inositol-3-phosphate glycosyltransferase